MDTKRLEAFSESDPIQRLYAKAIVRAQKGKHNNDYKQARFYILHQLVEQAIRRFPTLNLVECGCWHGHSTLIIAGLMELRSTGRLHVFDSFEGLSEFKQEDLSEFLTTASQREIARQSFKSSFDHMKKLTDPFGYVYLHKGWIPPVLNELDNSTLAFASIDVDMYEPTKASLDAVWPRLAVGGLVYLDDYGAQAFPGATLAIDRFVAANKPPFFLKSPIGSAFLIK
jgi:O-methyltransferase